MCVVYKFNNKHTDIKGESKMEEKYIVYTCTALQFKPAVMMT